MSHPGDIVALNDAQREAVNHPGGADGPLLVLAGPGTGKTRVIIARLLRLLREGHDPASLLAVTFSVKATREMQSRLSAWAGEHLPKELAAGAARVQISTFHGLGTRLTRRFGDVLGVAPEPALLDAALAKRLLRPILDELGLFPHLAAQGHGAVLTEHLRFESACKHNARTPDDALRHAREWAARLEENAEGLSGDALAAARLAQREFADHARLYEAFDRVCLKRGLFTFDDQLAYPLRVFRKRPELAAFVRAEHRHIVVDELQDVNPAQIELLRWIAPPGSAGTDLCAVGDDDQAIYSFRGSDPAAVEAFRAVWPEHRTVKLEENHRSAARIVAAGNAVIGHATARVEGGKTIRAAGGAHDKGPGSVEAYTVPDEKDHGHLAAALILADKARHPERPWSDYAVLGRGLDFLDRLAAALRLRGIPVDMRERPAPRDEPAVQDLFAWLGLLADGRDDASAQRLLVRPAFGVGIETVRVWREQHADERRRFAAERPGMSPREFPGFADWLGERHADDASAARFTALLSELRRATAGLNAERAVEHVVRAAHLMGDDSPELLDPAQRARRARALVDVIRFVRTRQAFLDHPGDLGAYLAYDRDLDDEGRNFRAPGLETEDPDESDRPDAVSVITAHSAKGLEWDTVIVARIGRTKGCFGTSGREEQGAARLPEGFTGRPAPSQEEEELRLLYVACTRAARRLILTAKKKSPPAKKDTSSDDVFVSLTHFHPELNIPVLSMEDALRSAGAETPSPLEEELAARQDLASRRERVRREIVFARQWAFAALHDAEKGELAGTEARLADAARAVAALARLRDGADSAAGPAPMPEGPLRERLETLRRELARGVSAHLWPAPAPPLRLSYTQIRSFEECPRCWYLRTVLGLADRGSTAANIGAIAHEALQQFYRRVRDADAGAGEDPDAAPGPPRGAELHRLADAAFDRGFPSLDPGADAERRKLHAQLDAMLERLHPSTHQVLELELDFRVPITDAAGVTHTLTGKIDRLDLLPDGGYRLIDYKTGAARDSLLNPKKNDLQLCVYAMALAEHVGSAEGPPAGVAEYWVLSKGHAGTIALSDLAVEKTRGTILTTIGAMLTPPYLKGKECKGHCDLLG